MARVALTDDNGALYGAPKNWVDNTVNTSLPSVALPVASQSRRTWPNVSIFEAVQSGHAFTVTGNGTSNLNDTTDYALGTQSIRVTTDGAGGNVDIKSSGYTLDMSDKHAVAWIKIDAPNKDAVKWLNLDLKTDQWNYYRSSLLVGGTDLERSPMKAGEWFPVFLNRGNFTVGYGTPTWSTITQIQVSVADNGGSNPVTVRLGGFGTFTEAPRYPNGVVSLTFDDSHTPLYLPKMSRLGYRGTLFPIVERIGQAGYMTAAQLRQMHDVNGFEIGVHAHGAAAHTSYTGETDAWVEDEVRLMRQWSRDNGYVSSSFAYPIGPYTAANSRHLAKHFAAQRGTGSTRPVLPQTVAHPGRIPSGVIGASVSLANVQDVITRTVSGKGWSVLCFHGVVAGTASGNDWTVANFEALMDHIAASGIAVAPLGDVVATNK